MKITIIGKRHAQGKRKSDGQSFDFLEFHYNGHDPYGSVEGLIGKKFTCNPDAIPYDSVQVGGTYDVQFDESGKVEHMAPASK